jgi:hypothetical protein
MSALSPSSGRLTGGTRKASRESRLYPERFKIQRPKPAIERHLVNYTSSVYQSDSEFAISYVVGGQLEAVEVYFEVKKSDAVIPLTDFDNDAQDFIDALILMPHVSPIDECIDVIFETFDELQLNGKFSRCDENLEYLLQKMDKIEPTLLVSFLVITLAAKSKLRFRNALYSAIESAFRVQFGEDRTKKILVGLK